MTTHDEKGDCAVYLQQALPEYRGNPFIEALPPILSVDEAIEALAVDPGYNEGEREMDTYYRLHAIRRLLRYFQPLYTHIDIEQRISCGIRQGYIGRNPIYTKNNRYLGNPTALGFTIIGMSGVGKTTGIERVLSLYPQCITHFKYENNPFYLKQIVWLKLECPFDGSIKGLCIDFFNTVDRVLESNYSQKFHTMRSTVDTMVPRIAQIADTHGIGMLIIDEIQHLSQAKSGGSEKMLNFFVNLVNTIGVPVVLIGTTKALPILQSEFRQARRGSGQGGLLWDRMQNDESWDIIMETMWKYQWTREKCPITRELKNLIYDESQGIIDIAVKLYVFAQIKAITDETESVTGTVIREAAGERLGLLKRPLDALRSGDISKIMMFEDIRPLDIDSYINSQITRFSPRDMDGDKIATLEEQAVLKLLEMDIAPKTARQCVKKAITMGNAGQTLAVTVRKAFKMAILMESPADGPNEDSAGDLRNIPMSDAHSELRLSGAIAPNSDEW